MTTDRVHDYGVLKRERSADEMSAHAERIRLLGYTVLPGGFSVARIAEFGTRLEQVRARQVEEFGGDARLAAIGDECTVRCPLVYDDAFLRLAAYAPLLDICRELIGDYIVLMQQNGVINPPQQTHTQSAYHRDLPYQHFTSSQPLAVSALFCIDPFTSETGATTVLPSTHKVETFPSDGLAQDLEVSVDAPAGSFIVFDSMLYHRAGWNRSDRPRRAVNHVFSIPLIAQQISLPDALRGRHADDPALARLLGYQSAPARSVGEWRQRRLERTSASRQ